MAPIPFGAGLKGKLWESMNFGIPNITTSVGAEAMHRNLPWNGFIEDCDENFIEKSIELYQNKNIWETSQENGFNISKNIYDKILYINHLNNKIENIKENLIAHRNHNFFGQILQHHQLNSTKYLSKWIEEKNKKTN